MKLKKCLLAFLIGFSLLFSSALTSCGDTPKANEDEVEQPDSEDKESEKDPEKDKESEEENDSEEAAKEKEYTVTFNVDGGSEIKSQTVKEGAKAEKPATNPTKTGYDFEGWFSDTAKTTAFDFNTVIKVDTTIYAKWKTAAGYFEVTFNTNGGSAIEKASVKEGEKVIKPADPKLDYNKFLGWYTDTTYKTEFNFDTAIKAAITLYAKWKPQGKVDISLVQNTEERITKSDKGHVFTAPEGYFRYEWKLCGYEDLSFASGDINENECSLDSNAWKRTLVGDSHYTIQVFVYDDSDELLNIFSYDFVY